MNKRTMITNVMQWTAIAGLSAVMVGCGSNWRTHEAVAISDAKPSTRNAPDWVQGEMPVSEDMVYFVGRSFAPDYKRSAYADGADHHGRTPMTRVGFTVMDEREAVQSARNDIYDQIRARLAPRNVGTTGQLASMNVDSGTCKTCACPLPMDSSTPVMSPCNAPCLYYHAPNHPGTGVAMNQCGPCAGDSLAHGDNVQVAAKCGGCDGAHNFTISRDAGCADCPTIVHAVTASFRSGDYMDSAPALARDMNVFNVGLDSVMPAMLANLNEERVYFEKWHVHEGHDHSGRPFAEGRDEWQSYKCWMLCSIPREEYNRIAEEFRGRYNELFDQTLEWAIEDRARRMAWEDETRQLEFARQEEERQWNREDELATRDHTIALDKDRHPLPGRRFSIVGSP